VVGLTVDDTGAKGRVRRGPCLKRLAGLRAKGDRTWREPLEVLA
jgi:hypothetical protein